MRMIHTRNMNLKQLQILVTLNEEKSVTQTAARLHMTQSAVSHALASLRRSFADPLFVATKNEMVPTQRALDLANHLRQALTHLHLAMMPPRDFEPHKCNTVFRIATNDYGSFVLLPPLLKRLAGEAPLVRLQFVPLEPERDWKRLADGSIDFALAYFRSIPNSLHARSLFEERYVCIARSGHPIIKRKLTLQRYLQLDHIAVAPYGTGLIDQQLGQRGMTRRVVLMIPNFLLIPELVTQSNLVATMGERVARCFARRLRLNVQPLPLPLERVAVSLVWHARTHSEPEHQWLRELIVQVAKNLG